MCRTFLNLDVFGADPPFTLIDPHYVSPSNLLIQQNINSSRRWWEEKLQVQFGTGKRAEAEGRDPEALIKKRKGKERKGKKRKGKERKRQSENFSQQAGQKDSFLFELKHI